MDILEDYDILNIKKDLEEKVQNAEASLDFLDTVNHSLSHSAMVKFAFFIFDVLTLLDPCKFCVLLPRKNQEH